jgi:hypothetical protein
MTAHFGNFVAYYRVSSAGRLRHYLAAVTKTSFFRRGAVPPLFRLFRIPRRFCGFAFQAAADVGALETARRRGQGIFLVDNRSFSSDRVEPARTNRDLLGPPFRQPIGRVT